MKISISTADLREALSLSQNTLGSTQDITSHFIFVKDGTGASVMSCSLPRTFTKVPLIGATVVGTGSFTMEGKRVVQAINAVSGVLEIESSDEDGSVSIKTENGSLALSSLNTESFPPWVEKFNSSSKVSEISASILHDVISSLKAYVSTEDNRRPELAMLYVDGGKAYACDGFGMSVAQHDDLQGISLKIHTKDLAPLQKFLKSSEGHVIEILNGEHSHFFKAEDGAVFGVMGLTHTFPSVVFSYAEAFSWTPNNVWGVTKESLTTAIKFLRAGADSSDVKVGFIDEGGLLAPKLSMRPSNGKGDLSYTLTTCTPEDMDQEIELYSDLGERMYVARQREASDINIKEFGFNYHFMLRALESCSSNVYIGCNQEANKGYMVFKNRQDSGVETVSVVGWMV